MKTKTLGALFCLGLFTLAGCQVVSGLTGIDVEGSGGGASSNICELANEHFQTCKEKTGVQPPTMFSVDKCVGAAKCDAGCYEMIACADLKKSGTVLKNCLAACR